MATRASVKRTRRLALGCTTAVVLLIAAVTLAAGWAWWRWRTEPGYWQDNRAFLERTPRSQLQDLANRAEQQVLSSLGGGEVRQVRLSTAELNAWLALRLESWAANQGLVLPDQVGRFMVQTSSAGPTLAFQLNQGELHQVVSLDLAVQVDEAGQGQVRLTGLRAGSLPISPQWIAEHLQGQAGADASRQLQRLVEGVPFDAQFPDPTNRKRRLQAQALQFDAEGASFRLQALAP